MEKRAFFNAEQLNTAVESLCEIRKSVLLMLGIIFGATSLIAGIFGSSGVFEWLAYGSFGNVLLFVAVISFLILLVGYKNLGYMHYYLAFAFVVSFGCYTCFVVGTNLLAFTLPAAVWCVVCFWLVRSSCPTNAALILSAIVLAALTGGLTAYWAQSTVLGCMSALHLLLFAQAAVITFKRIAGYLTNHRHYALRPVGSTVLFLAAVHIMLTHLCLLAAVLLVVM